MRRLLLLSLAAALAACGAPAAQGPTPGTLAPTFTPPTHTPYDPATGLPSPTPEGQAPATVTPGGPTPTTAPTVTPVAANPSPTPITSAAPLAAIGYGHALSAAFAGPDALAVGTSAGLLFLGLPDLAPRQFVPLPAAANELAASPDGRHLAASSYDGPTALTRLLDAAGAELAALPGRQPVFSRDGALLAVAELDNAAGRYTTRLYDPAAPSAPIAEAPGDRPVISPDGRVFATFDRDEVVITAVGGQESFRGPAAHAAFSPDGGLVAVGGLQGVELLPIVNGSAVAAERRSLSAELTLDLAFDPAGRLVALGYDALRRWDVGAGGEPERVAIALGGDIGAIGPGATILALTSIGGDAPSELRLVRAADGSELYADAALEGGDASFSADGRRAAVVTDAGTVRLVGDEQGAGAERIVAAYEAVAFGAGDSLLVARQGGRGAERWRPTGAAPEAAVAVASDWLARTRQLSADGPQVVLEQEVGSFLGGLWRLEARGWDGGAGPVEPLASDEIPGEQLAYEDRVPWDFSPAAEIFARGVAPSAGGGVLVGDPAGGAPRPLPALAGVPTSVAPTSLAFSPDGARLAVGYGDGTLLVAGVADLGPVAAGPLGAGEAITALAWSGDGTRLAFALAGGDVAVWEVGEDEAPRRIAAPRAEAGAPALALSRDGAALAVGAPSGLALYTTADGAERLRLPLPADSVALGDGGLLAATSRGQVFVWQAPL